MDQWMIGLFNMPGNTELIVILAIGLLLFGKRLPEVGRSVGKSIVEFKKGIKGIEDDIDRTASAQATPVTPKAIPDTNPYNQPKVAVDDGRVAQGAAPAQQQVQNEGQPAASDNGPTAGPSVG